MKIITFRTFRSVTSGLLALVFFFTLLPLPAAQATGAGAQAETVSLTATDVTDMGLADAAVATLTGSDEYAAMPLEERRAAADEELQALAEEELIEGNSIYYDEENQMITFSYACGVLGGVLLRDLDELEPAGGPDVSALAAPEAENAVLTGRLFGYADIYYAFDNTVNSARYPYYAAMQQTWSEAGLATRIHTNLTVSRMKHIESSDLCILSMHGSYYTYTYGRLWRRSITAPILILMEQSTWYKDLLYAADLLTHRVIKVNGLYCLLPSFFQSHYGSGDLAGTILFSETCDFFGYNCESWQLSDALLAAGARTVIGYRHTVYATYSRNVMWDTVNQLVYGATVQQALNHATEHYGVNDVIWYSSLSTKRPHALASYPLWVGDGSARLY